MRFPLRLRASAVKLCRGFHDLSPANFDDPTSVALFPRFTSIVTDSISRHSLPISPHHVNCCLTRHLETSRRPDKQNLGLAVGRIESSLTHHRVEGARDPSMCNGSSHGRRADPWGLCGQLQRRWDQGQPRKWASAPRAVPFFPVPSICELTPLPDSLGWRCQLKCRE